MANVIETLKTVREDVGVNVYDDCMPPDTYTKLLRVSQPVGWRFGWNTPSNPGARYWHHEVGYGNKQNLESVSDRVRQHPAKIFATYMDWLLEQLPQSSKILRFYLNARTFGTDGWPHIDTDRQGERTGILYLNDKWQPAWGGETAIFNARGDVTDAVLPRRNRLLVFPSDALHAPRPLTRAYTGLRAPGADSRGPGFPYPRVYRVAGGVGGKDWL